MTEKYSKYFSNAFVNYYDPISVVNVFSAMVSLSSNIQPLDFMFSKNIVMNVYQVRS